MSRTLVASKLNRVTYQAVTPAYSFTSMERLSLARSTEMPSPLPTTGSDPCAFSDAVRENRRRDSRCSRNMAGSFGKGPTTTVGPRNYEGAWAIMRETCLGLLCESVGTVDASKLRLVARAPQNSPDFGCADCS